VTCIFRNIGDGIETGFFQRDGGIPHAIRVFKAATAHEYEFDLRLVFDIFRPVSASAEEAVVPTQEPSSAFVRGVPPLVPPGPRLTTTLFASGATMRNLA